MKHHILFLLSLLVVLASCGDDLAGTYSDFTDGKPIHYAGKVKNVAVNPGWQCLRATWTLSNDPAVKNIVVTCASESDTVQQTLAPTATSCKIENLTNKDYTVKVQSLDTDGSLSLADPVVSRPYTYDHESVRAFTRGVSKAFLAKTHLLLVMGNWENGIEDFHISFTTTDGSEQTKQLSQQDFSAKYLDLSGVDTSKPVILHRSGRIAGCEDLIQFEDYTFTKEVLLNTDFASEMTGKYGMSNDDETGFAAFVEKARKQEVELWNKCVNSFVGAYILVSNMKDMPATMVRSRYEQLPADLREKGYGKVISEYLAQAERIMEGKTAPDFTLPTVEGDSISMHDLKGKVKIIDFWASWCAPCRHEMPNLVKLYKTYQTKGLEILSVSIDDKKDKWINAIFEDGNTWKNVSDLKGAKSPIVALYGIKSVPFMLVLDENNKILAVNLRGKALEDKIAQLLK